MKCQKCGTDVGEVRLIPQKEIEKREIVKKCVQAIYKKDKVEYETLIKNYPFLKGEYDLRWGMKKSSKGDEKNKN